MLIPCHFISSPLQLVKRAVVRGMEARKEDLILSLLNECAAQGLISTNQMIRGFLRVAEALPDLVLDIPDARARLGNMVEGAKEKEILPKTLVVHVEQVVTAAA